MGEDGQEVERREQEEMSEIDDADKVEIKDRRVRMRDKRQMDTLGFVMSSPEGRRFVNHLLDLCGIMKLSYSGPGKAEDTAFYEGQRNIGNNIFRTIDAHFPTEYALMRSEAKLEDTKNA